MTTKNNDNLKERNKIFRKIKKALQSSSQFCYVKNPYDAITKQDGIFIWIGTKVGSIGNEKCHYEFIFNTDVELSLEVHFHSIYNDYFLKGSSIEKINSNKIDVLGWKYDRGTKRLVYPEVLNIIKDKDNIEALSITMLNRLHMIIGQDIIEVIKHGNTLSSKNGKPSSKTRVTHKKITVGTKYSCPHHKVEVDLINALKRKHKNNSSKIVGYERILGSIQPDVFENINNQYTIYEVKPYVDPIDCIQEALGQILFYSYTFETNIPKYKVGKLYIVGPNPKTLETEEFINYIKVNYGLIGIDYICPKDVK